MVSTMGKPTKYSSWHYYLQVKQRRGHEVSPAEWIGAWLGDCLEDRHPGVDRTDIFKAYLHCFHGFNDRYTAQGPVQVQVNQLVALVAYARDPAKRVHIYDNVYAVFRRFGVDTRSHHPVFIAMSRETEGLPVSILPPTYYASGGKDEIPISHYLVQMKTPWERYKGYKAWKNELELQT